ncbi:Non-heme 11 kDa protein of cytochrome bc1 complex, partial [Eremomyces bilateralis CBS 781.70]
MLSIISDIISSFTAVAHAEAAEEEKPEEQPEAQTEEASEEEEEEEEEPEDVMPKLVEDCAERECHTQKHHYDDCARRVTQQMDENDGKANEDCVEEFFHLTHCATACAAPKLWKTL